MSVVISLFFSFKQKTAYERRMSDWSSDVCSSDLDREDPVPFILAQIDVASLPRHARAGDSGGDLAPGAHRRRDGGAHLLFARDIGLDEFHVVGRRCDQRGQIAVDRFLSIRDDHLRPLGHEQPRRCAADSRRAASNRSEEHTSELQSLMRISYAAFCLKKKTQKENTK